MANKLIFALFGLLYLISLCHAAPLPSPQESSVELNLKGFIQRLKLVALSLEEFADLYAEVVEKGPKVFTDVLKDPKVLEVKTVAMEEQIQILRNYIDKFEQSKKDNKKANIFELVEEYDDIIDKFDSKKNNLSPEATIIEKSLEENGLLNLEKSIFEHFEKFLVKFNAKVETYLKGLNEKEKKDEEEFIEWYEKLNSEKDTEKKIEMFESFFEVEDD